MKTILESGLAGLTSLSARITSDQHSLAVVVLCLLCIVMVITVAVIREAVERHRQKRESEMICIHCFKGKLEKRYLQMELSSRSTAPGFSAGIESLVGAIKNLFSVKDYLTQVQATCQNPGCSYKCSQNWNDVKKGRNMPVVIRTEVKHWRLRNRVTRFKQLRHTVTISYLLPDDMVRRVLRERGMAEPHRKVPFKKPELQHIPLPPK